MAMAAAIARVLQNLPHLLMLTRVAAEQRDSNSRHTSVYMPLPRGVFSPIGARTSLLLVTKHVPCIGVQVGKRGVPAYYVTLRLWLLVHMLGSL